MGKERPTVNAAARQAIEELLAQGVNVCVRVGPEGKVIVEAMTRKIVYRAP